MRNLTLRDHLPDLVAREGRRRAAAERLKRAMQEELVEFGPAPGHARICMDDEAPAFVETNLLVHARTTIDAEFAQMASDRAYQEEAMQVAEEFAKSDWEALRIAEGKP